MKKDLSDKNLYYNKVDKRIKKDSVRQKLIRYLYENYEFTETYAYSKNSIGKKIAYFKIDNYKVTDKGEIILPTILKTVKVFLYQDKNMQPGHFYLMARLNLDTIPEISLLRKQFCILVQSHAKYTRDQLKKGIQEIEFRLVNELRQKREIHDNDMENFL